MINFNVPPFVGREIEYIQDAIRDRKICGDGKYTKRCNEWLERFLNVSAALLTTSCTHATEMAMILSDVQPYDEVIMPSFAFVSAPDSVVLRGATPVFVDIRPDTMNIDEKLIENAVTAKTKAIMPIHYAGVSCDMDVIMDVARRHDLRVIEDAAQAIGSKYKGRHCGTIGDYGCLSFHETKNVSMGEGGALLIRDNRDLERAEIIREKGTNRSQFFRGQIDKYTWVDMGSSYLPSELNAAYLFAQLQAFDEIEQSRLNAWNLYYELLKPLESEGIIDIPKVPEDCEHNAHMFYIKTEDLKVRTKLIDYLKKNEIMATFHYVPLHLSPAGIKYGRFHGEDKYTLRESERLLRLPLFYGIKGETVEYVVDKIKEFYR